MTKTFDFSPVLSCAVAMARAEEGSDMFALDSFSAMMDCVDAQGLPYKEVRSHWIGSYVAARGCSEKSGQNRFAEMCKVVGFMKPQSEEAKRKTPVKKGARTKTAKPETASPASAGDAAGFTFAQLSTLERTLIEAVLKHQWALVAALADQAAEVPMVDEVHTIDV